MSDRFYFKLPSLAPYKVCHRDTERELAGHLYLKQLAIQKSLDHILRIIDIVSLKRKAAAAISGNCDLACASDFDSPA